MGVDPAAVIEALFKGAITAALFGALGWFLFWFYVEGNIGIKTCALAGAVLLGLFLLAVLLIWRGGWSFLWVNGAVVSALVCLALLQQRETSRLNASMTDEDLQRAQALLAREPRSAYGHLRLADALRALGRVDEAVQAYEAAAELDPESSDAKTARSRLKELCG